MSETKSSVDFDDNIDPQLHTQILLKGTQIFEHYLFNPWKCSAAFIEKEQLKMIQKQLKHLQIENSTKIVDICQQQLKTISINIQELIETTIQQLNDDMLYPTSIEIVLNSILKYQMRRMLFDCLEFHISDIMIIMKYLQNLMVRILEDFYQYQTRVSLIANSKMAYLEQTMQQYPAIANKENYKYMQREVSTDVIDTCTYEVQFRSFARDDELNQKIAKQSIKHFYYLIEERNTSFELQVINEEELILEMKNFLELESTSSSQVNSQTGSKKALQLSKQQIDSQEDLGVNRLMKGQKRYKKLAGSRKPIRYGTNVNAVAGKAFGAGLGQLLVDSFDEDIPWEEKLQNAGFTTITLGTLGLLASRLPIVGILVQQVVFAFAVKKILENKVISDSETGKNLFHLTVQITIGVSLTIAGGIIWPAFWGALLGGFFGGVGMGVYSKVIVVRAMENLVLMMEKASKRIRKDGSIRYSAYVVEKMRFDIAFFDQHVNYTDDEWLTILMYCLANEVRSVSKANFTKQYLKLMKNNNNPQNSEIIALLRRQVQIEIQLGLYDDCLRFIKQQRISILQNAALISEFVEGMLNNFKIL